MNNENLDNKKENKEFYNKLNEFKYKLYIFVIALSMYIFWFYILSNSLQEVQSLSIKNKELQKEQKSIEREIEDVKKEKNIIDKSKENKGNILKCINTNECEKLSQSLKNNLKYIKNYFLLSEVNTKKMDYDQKLILQNIYNFLISHNNGNINIISFGSLAVEDYQKGLYKLPISLSVDFPSKDSLIKFLDKVENKIHKSLPVLYKIDSVNYNIMNYENKQTVNISMNAYFFKF